MSSLIKWCLVALFLALLVVLRSYRNNISDFFSEYGLILVICAGVLIVVALFYARKRLEEKTFKKLCLATLGITLSGAFFAFAVGFQRSGGDFKIILVIGALVIGGAAITAVFYVMKRLEEKAIATIPVEFRYIYVNIAHFFFVNFIAIDLRNQKMLLELDGTRKMYDFADIQGHERDTREMKVRRTTYKSNGSMKCGTGKKTVYDLILHVSDQAKPTWQFSSGIKDEMDCAELLVSRALDGTLPGSFERRVLNLRNLEKFKSFLSQDTWEQG